MSHAKRAEFDIFYDKNKNNVFDFHKEFLDYCWSDVLLLTEGCLRYSKISRQNTERNNDGGYCPIRNELTLSGYCNHIYRRLYLPSKTISYLPANGYDPKANMSLIARFILNFYQKLKELGFTMQKMAEN